MSRNYAQKFVAQVVETRESLAKQSQRDGLAESVRQDMIKQTRAAAREREKTFEHDFARAKATPVTSGARTVLC